MAQPHEILSKLIAQYEGYFDIEQPHIYGNKEIPAYAHYRQRTERYMLSKKAQLYATEIDEHVFFVHIPYLDKTTWETEKNLVINAERDYVVPHSEHMYSYITLILLCDGLDNQITGDIRKLRYTKNYKFSLHGYSTVRIAVLDIKSGSIFTNSRGKELRKVLEYALT